MITDITTNTQDETLSFEEYVDIENEKNGPIYPFDTLEMIISLKEQHEV